LFKSLKTIRVAAWPLSKNKIVFETALGVANVIDAPLVLLKIMMLLRGSLGQHVPR